MKVDFHMHTSRYSGCARSGPKEQIKAAVDAGVDVVFITEHEKLFPQNEIDVLQEKFPQIRIYQGIEVTVRDNSYDDFLVLGVHDKGIEKGNWTYRALHNYVMQRGGAIILAHPYRFSDEVNQEVWKFAPSAVEVLSSNIGSYGYERRKILAEELGCPIVTNSDSHIVDNTGCFTNEFSWECYDEAMIIDALCDGSFEAMKLVQ